MNRLPVTLLLVAVLAPVAASAEVVKEMTPALIESALKDTQSRGCYPLTIGSSLAMTKRDIGCFTTPYSRVVAAAKAARKKYQPFSAADVTPDMIAPELRVIAAAVPKIHGRGGGIISPEAVVLMPVGAKDAATAIQPVKTEEVDEVFSNAYGTEWHGKTIVATFPLEHLSEKNELRIVYDGPCGSGGPGARGAEGGFATDCGARLKLDKVR